MVSPIEELDRWCRGVPGLAKVGDGFWSQAQVSAVSFPEEGLSTLADIEPGSFWFNHRNDVIAAAIRRYPPSGTIFDIGGGNAYVSARLKSAGFDCIVVEPDAHGAKLASVRGLPVIRAAFQDLSVADGSIASAGLFDVLEHVEDDLGALQRLHRALKPSGMVYIAVPTYGFLWSSEDVHAGHYRRYTLDGLRARLREAGFAPVYGTYFFAALVPAVLLLRSLPSWLGYRSSDPKAQAARDHALPGGLAGQALRRSFRYELSRIAAGGSVPCGTSCLVAARRVENAPSAAVSGGGP